VRVAWAIAAALLVPAACVAAPSEQLFDWSTSSSAPTGTPMWIVAGGFSAGDESMSGIPTNTSTHDGWGVSNSAHVGGPDRKRAPDRLEVLFYSWIEDRFYQGDFKLPQDRIAQLLREGLVEGKGKVVGELSSFTVGVTPGGGVAVWVGLPERDVEVFFGQATPVTSDWHDTLGLPRDLDKRKFIEESLADAAKRDPLVTAMRAKLPIERWAEFRTRYRWRLRFDGVSDPTDVYVPGFVNGESDRSWRDTPFGGATGSVGAAPTRLIFTSQRFNRRWEIVLDDAESFAASSVRPRAAIRTQ
jgi:hypothetical protein